MAKSISFKSFKEWDMDKDKWASNIAEDAINEYNRGNYFYSLTLDQTPSVMKYIMMKVWHILSGSGIFLEHRVKRRGDKNTIMFSMSEQSPEYVDAPSDSDSDELTET
jgi:hypothetical protein